jgi:hypothetical protein
VILVRRKPEEGEIGFISCIAANKKTVVYRDSVKTICGNFIIMPWETYLGYPSEATCRDCLARFKGKELRKTRLELGLSLREAAQILLLSPTRLGEFERGKALPLHDLGKLLKSGVQWAK